MVMNDSVNFLPWRRTRLLRQLRYWGLCVCAVWLVCGVVVWAAWGHWQDEQRVHEIHARMAQHMSQQLAERVKQRNAQRLQSAQLRQRQAGRQKTQAWSSRLTQLAEKLPAPAWLTALSYRDGVLSLTGTLTQFSAFSILDEGFASVANFLPGQAEKIQRDSEGLWLFEYQLREDVGHETP